MRKIKITIQALMLIVMFMPNLAYASAFWEQEVRNKIEEENSRDTEDFDDQYETLHYDTEERGYSETIIKDSGNNYRPDPVDNKAPAYKGEKKTMFTNKKTESVPKDSQVPDTVPENKTPSLDYTPRPGGLDDDDGGTYDYEDDPVIEEEVNNVSKDGNSGSGMDFSNIATDSMELDMIHIGGPKSLSGVIGKFLKLLNFSIVAISVMGVMIGSFLMIISAGDESQIERGKSIFKFSIIGLVVTLAAYMIVSFAQTLLYSVS
jgi:hypothetical protein